MPYRSVSSDAEIISRRPRTIGLLRAYHVVAPVEAFIEASAVLHAHLNLRQGLCREVPDLSKAL